MSPLFLCVRRISSLNNLVRYAALYKHFFQRARLCMGAEWNCRLSFSELCCLGSWGQKNLKPIAPVPPRLFPQNWWGIEMADSSTRYLGSKRVKSSAEFSGGVCQLNPATKKFLPAHLVSSILRGLLFFAPVVFGPQGFVASAQCFISITFSEAKMFWVLQATTPITASLSRKILLKGSLKCSRILLPQAMLCASSPTTNKSIPQLC